MLLRGNGATDAAEVRTDVLKAMSANPTEQTYPPPGPALDALVAEKVMGEPLVLTCKYCFKDTTRQPDALCTHCGYSHPAFDLPPYSTDIAAAWEVVEKLKGYMPLGGSLLTIVKRYRDAHRAIALTFQDSAFADEYREACADLDLLLAAVEKP